VHGVLGDTGVLAAIGPTLVNALVGIVAGGLAVAVLVGVKKVLPAKKA
jgi:predicted DNA repair protein MutK